MRVMVIIAIIKVAIADIDGSDQAVVEAIIYELKLCNQV